MTGSIRRPNLLTRITALSITVVVSGLGLLSIATQYAPERLTRFGIASALTGQDATHFGVSMFLAGLLPLMLLMKSPHKAAWFGSIVGTALVLSLFLAVR